MRTMRISSLVQSMMDSPIDRLNQHCHRLVRQGKDMINLGQAVPGFAPPSILVEKTIEALGDPDVHLYTSDLGLPALRQAVANHLQQVYHVSTARPEEIVITAGANHAFLLACACLFEPGDRVGLLSPFFLNHHMSIHGRGATAIEILPDQNFCYSEDQLDQAIRQHQLRALVVVNPCNPTGKVFSKAELTTLLGVCQRHGIWLISDEVYSAFVYDGVPMVSVGSLPGAAERTIVLGSFSKEYAMTGWRVGWMRVPESLIPQFLKIQDYSIICAPHLSQIGATCVLADEPRYANQFLKEFSARRMALTDRLRRSRLFQLYSGDGAFFVWCRPPVDVDSNREVYELLNGPGLCVMPGSMFGDEWKSWFRISYGKQPVERLIDAADRLIEYFSH